jgi:hypothetical protein
MIILPARQHVRREPHGPGHDSSTQSTPTTKRQHRQRSPPQAGLHLALWPLGFSAAYPVTPQITGAFTGRGDASQALVMSFNRTLMPRRLSAAAVG